MSSSFFFLCIISSSSPTVTYNRDLFSGIMNLITTITILEVSKVRSCSVGKATRIELTPWDLQFLLLQHIQKGILFYKPAPAASSDSEEGFEFDKTIIPRLRTSLSRTLDFFPPLAGRLGAGVVMGHDGEKVGFFIDCNDAGVEFIQAIARGVSVSDILEPTYTPAVVSSFFPLTGVSNCDVSKPLFGVQVTELVDGYFIGCSANHAVIDGTAFWHFVNSWSEISRGSEAISKPPVLERWFSPSASGATNRLIPVVPPEKMTNHFISPNPPPLLERVFHFSKEAVSNLKAKANSEAGTDKISSLQSVLSHIWRSATRIRRQQRASNTPEKEISLLLLIGTRRRMLLPDGYFGNAVYATLATANENELSENGLGWAATNLNKLVAQQTIETATKLVQNWATDPMIVGKLATTKLDFGTSSSTRYDIYGNDFGWGKPVAVRSGKGQKVDGKLTVFPGTEAGSIDVEACLAKETIHGLEDDVEFMGAFIF